MKTKLHCQHGLSLVELAVIVATVVLVAGFILPLVYRPHRNHSCRIQCVNNLKQIGLSYRLYSNDHNDQFPFAVSNQDGGTLDFVNSPQVFRHYESMSNELNTPKILVCPNDEQKVWGANFLGGSLSNTNVSYFVGLDADENKPERLLSGDRNVTGGVLRKGFLRMFNTNSLAGWTTLIHSNAGNIVLADGSVQQVTGQTLQRQLQIQSLDIIRLAIP